MFPKKLVCALTCGALIFAATVRAEDEPAPGVLSPEAESLLRVGARVRINEPNKKLKTLTGRVLSVDDQRLWLEMREGKEPLEVRRADIHTLEISMGRRRATRKGAIIGGISLAIPGILLGAAAGAFSQWECSRCDDNAALKGAITGGVFVGALGTGLGAVVGSAFTVEDWQAPAPKRVSARLFPTKRGVAASISFRF